MTDEPVEWDRRTPKGVQKKQSPTYDAYPDAPPDPTRIRFFVVAFDQTGASIDGEEIDTDRLDAREFLATAKRRSSLATRAVAATSRLVARIDSEAEAS